MVMVFGRQDDSMGTGNRREPVVNYSSEDARDSQSYTAGRYPGR